MFKTKYMLFISFLFINVFIPSFQSNLSSNPINSGEKVYQINEAISGDINHKKAEFTYPTGTGKNLYFKYQYDSSELPSSLITTFRVAFDSYSTSIANYKILCANAPINTQDSELINILNNTKDGESACINGFKRDSFYDGFVRLDKEKNLLGIIIKETNDGLSFSGRVNLRIKERILETNELKPNDKETYALIPYTITLQKFRDKSASKILFYSYSRNLQMFYPSSKPNPEKLFAGNILSVYTNPNMIRQKYQNATIMTLIMDPSENTEEKLEEDFQFEVKLFESNYLLDYYVSTNSEGRTLKKPLLINMTECTNPYYVILNYNRAEDKKSLILDNIYGKIKSLSVANEFTKNTWDEMISTDMKEINVIERKYQLPEGSVAHLDVYKIECDLPLMLNFYYLDENDLIEKMNYGDINIFTLQPYEIVNVPFFSIKSPEVIIEIYNPFNTPTVIVSVNEETVYQSNTLIRIVPITLSNGITIKERGGLNETRIIIKAGYSRSDWQSTSDPNVQYNANEDVYAFKFPTTADKYNYTIAFLNTSGTDDDDNVKYCFTTNIGAALKPSSENCYRVSKDNPYCLKVYNPLNMFKDYTYDESLAYYVTFKTDTKATEFNVKAFLMTYDTKDRNFKDINNKVTITNGKAASVLTALPEFNEMSFLQIQVCDRTNTIKAKIKKPLTEETIVAEKVIASNTKNNYILYNNILLDSEVEITGNDNTEIFLRYIGMPSGYTPQFNNNYKITFDSSTNTLIIDSPIVTYEYMRYTVIVDKENKIALNSTYTLCAFANSDISKLGVYQKSTTADGPGSIQINFAEIGLKAGDRFDAIVYIEQLMYSKMAFLSDVIQESVGEISIDTFHEISETYTEDSDYVHLSMEAKASDLNYYFSYLPKEVMEVPFGALRIELDDSTEGNFTEIYCAFVNNDTDALGRIQELEKLIDVGDSYCIGSNSKINSKRYNYIFKYENNDNVPKMLIIKLINGGEVNGKFNIYIRQAPGEEIINTDFKTQQKYGEDENIKKSFIPYIVDLRKIRGDESSENKTSKILFYSQNSELQMYYVPEDQIHPVKLFSGNIALAYTKPDLAVQKYHATTLILLSQNLDEDEVDDNFRFHTKMFRSEDQIEFFVSQNPEGRTLNFPLSLEMNVCTENNKKLYYLLNYNKPEELRTLHLDMVFGTYLRARIAREINKNTWDDLISSGMSEISDYQADLEKKNQHIDVIEIECVSPLLINAYYSYEGYPYQNVKQGEIVVKDLLPDDDFRFTIEPQEEELFYYSLSLYNPIEVPYVTVRFSDGTEHYISGNTLKDGMLLNIPEEVTIINKVKTKTRFIFKIGINVERGKNWDKDTSVDLDGTLFMSENKYVYKFPTGDNKRSYTKIDFLVNGINQDVVNVKFCYSTNLGVAMEASRENCFRTGRYIPYTLTFINPLIVSKNYETTIDKYYIAFRPFEDTEHIKLQITENTYESPNRNDEGVAKMITLSNKTASTILSLPQYKTTNIQVQLRSCTPSELPVTYILNNAFTQEFIKTGKTYYYNDDTIGITFTTDKTNLENELVLQADDLETNTVSAFVKHTAIGNGKIDTQEGYKDITFDDTKNSVLIKKPIINEEFTITIIVDRKGTLGKYTQCDLAFTDKSKIGKYSKTFISVTSNTIIHFIDFAFYGFDIGDEFDLLVYAQETNNFKLEFLYPLFQGKVGEVSGVEAVSDYIEDNKYVTLNFKYNLNSNYLYYDFTMQPLGESASLKIITNEAKVTKVSCTFVSKYASDSTMISSVNNAMLENKNVCLDLGHNNNNEFNALIKASFTGEYSRLVVQVIYGFAEENKDEEKLRDELITINIRVGGRQFGDFTGLFELDEKLAPTPYVINLQDVRKKRINNKYVSKLLIYSNTTTMTTHYLSDKSSTPLKLFSGNIMLIYTNPDMIYQKYSNATTMILTTDALKQTTNIINVKYFDSESQIQYYLSNNEEGRVLNNPTAIEMTSCDRPYYYILNYNQVEESRKLHIDTIFGEAESIRLTNWLNHSSWDKLIENLEDFNEEQIVLKKSNTSFDVMEVKCKLPLLLNLYYTDPNNIKTQDIEVGDIVIVSIKNGDKQTLKFKQELKGPFAYSFSVYLAFNVDPNIKVTFDNDPEYDEFITKTGLYTKDSPRNYETITLENLDRSSGMSTRIIFKFGYVIESIFTPIGNGIYQNIDEASRTINLYAYKYDSTSTRLNYTGVDFDVSTNEENVKFCYSTNLGTYIIPSITNCYRVGKNNPYTISTRNPLIMYKNYSYGNVRNYYVGFRTIELNQEIKITPKPIKYDTTERNLEGAKNKVTLTEKSEYSTILTAPTNNEDYIFTHIHVCTKGQGLNYEFYNAYSGVNLGYNGYIMADTSFNYLSVPNSKLDTELKLKGALNTEIFVKHVGIKTIYQPNIEKITFSYNSQTQQLKWTQPIKDQEFKYTIYVDKIDNIKNKGYTLCSIINTSKLGRYSEILTTNSNAPYITLDFTKPDLVDCKEFDVIVVAEQTNLGKLTILSPVYNSKGKSSDDKTDNNDGDDEPQSNTGLIVIIIILSIIIIGGGIAAFFIIRKYKSKGMMSTDGKQTSMAMLGSAQNDKLVESQAEVDP